MTKYLTMTIAGLAILSLTACGGKKTDAEKAMDKAEAKTEQTIETTKDAATEAANDMTNKAYTKADFMKACEVNLTSAQCDCYVDFYASIGLDVKDLGDQEKVTQAVQGLKPDEAMKMAKCVQ
jgi:hypothetical protein